MVIPGQSKVHPVDLERIVPFELLLDRIAAEREGDWIQCRRTFHRAPEPSGREVATSRAIIERLKALGIPARIPERGVGVIADFVIGTPDECPRIVAVRADIDALPMQDRKSVSYASECPGLAHSCGHDAHTTVVLATAELLQTITSRSQAAELPSVHIRFVFQPAEETCEGALWMIEDGALDQVSAILGLHVDPTIRVGQVGIRYGVLTAQVDEVLIQIRGKGGHAARPQHSTDPIASASLLISGLYQLVPRNADALVPTVFTIGSIHGGTASNIIPDRVDITGTLRTTDAVIRQRVMNIIRKQCESLAAVTGNQIEVEFRSPLGSVINDTFVTSAFESATRQVVSDEGVVIIDKPSMGGEDFAMYINHVRGAQIRLGCAGGSEDWPLLHSPIFDIDEQAIAIGARIMARTALLLAMIPRD